MNHDPASRTAPPGVLHAPAALVDLERYPIEDPEAPAARRLVEGCRDRLAAGGCCILPGFLTAAGTAAMAAEANAAAPDAYFCSDTHNAYLLPDDPSFPDGHPRRRREQTDVGSIAFDRLPPAGALCSLYAWDPVVDFIGSVTGRRPLYRHADPLGALSVNVFREGGRHGWHFDEAEYTTTIMLQTPERGGEFEYVTQLRDPGREDYAAVGAVLDGDRSRVERLPFEPGTLSLFCGRRSLHRVTTVEGGRLRLVAVLCFAGEPGVRNSDEVRKLFWGRTR